MSTTEQSVLPESGMARPHFDLKSRPRESRAPLEQVPEGLQFPAEVLGRICFDSARRELVLRGFMSEEDYSSLQRLSDDNDYRRALTQLYQNGALQTVGDAPVAPIPIWLWALVAACFVAAGLIWWCWLVGS